MFMTLHSGSVCTIQRTLTAFCLGGAKCHDPPSVPKSDILSEAFAVNIMLVPTVRGKLAETAATCFPACVNMSRWTGDRVYTGGFESQTKLSKQAVLPSVIQAENKWRTSL